MSLAVDRRQIAAVTWGVVGALSFLVLVLGYQLLGGPPVDPPVMGGVAGAVGVAAGGLSYVLEGALADRSP